MYLKLKERGQGMMMISLPHKKRGRRLLLGEKIDTHVQMYLSRLRDAGGVITARIAIAAAKGMIYACDRSMLVEFGGHVELNCSWAYSLLSQMDFVKRKATTAAKSKLSVESFASVKRQFLADVASTVQMEEIPMELILNFDQTGIKIVPSSTWTMDRRGVKRVEITGLSDKRQITAVFCGSLIGDFLPVQVIYKGKTSRCHPSFSFPSDWHITHSHRHWSTECTIIDYINHIIVPYVNATRVRLGQNAPALVIMDNFKGQTTPQINEIFEQHNIHACLLPPNTTDRLQPMDLSVNKPAKDFLKRRFEEWYAGKIYQQLEGSDLETAGLQPVDLSMPVLKEKGAEWLTEMGEYLSDNPQIIVNGFIRSGISDAIDGNNKEDSGSNDSYESDGAALTVTGQIVQCIHGIND